MISHHFLSEQKVAIRRLIGVFVARIRRGAFVEPVSSVSQHMLFIFNDGHNLLVWFERQSIFKYFQGEKQIT